MPNVASIKQWIGHLKWVKQHPNKEESDDYYQKIIDAWEAKLNDVE